MKQILWKECFMHFIMYYFLIYTNNNKKIYISTVFLSEMLGPVNCFARILHDVVLGLMINIQCIHTNKKHKFHNLKWITYLSILKTL